MNKTIKDITIVVPVKSKSERVKNKNLKRFGNTSLYHLKLKQLKKTKMFNKIIVSSEDQKILDYALKKGFDIHKRDKYYSTSKVPMSEVYSYIASEISGENIAWVNVTNPFADSFIYDEAAKLYLKMNLKKNDCLLSANTNKQNYFYKNKTVNFKPSPWPRSQDLIPLISLPFVINILKRKNMIKWGSCVGKKPKFFGLNPLLSLDIDDQLNFDICEIIFKNKIFKKIKREDVFEDIP